MRDTFTLSDGRRPKRVMAPDLISLTTASISKATSVPMMTRPVHARLRGVAE